MLSAQVQEIGRRVKAIRNTINENRQARPLAEDQARSRCVPKYAGQPQGCLSKVLLSAYR